MNYYVIITEFRDKAVIPYVGCICDSFNAAERILHSAQYDVLSKHGYITLKLPVNLRSPLNNCIPLMD